MLRTGRFRGHDLAKRLSCGRKIAGTMLNDTLKGTVLDDQIYRLNADEIILGDDGNDRI